MITRIAVLSTDNREQSKAYDCPEPNFGTAPEALLQGFAQLPQVEIHVVSCTQQPMRSPAKLAENTWFHSLHVPKFGWMRTAYAGCIRAVRKKLQEIQPDIVHGQGTERDCALAAVFSGYPNVITIHGHLGRIAEIQRSRPFSFHWLAARFEVLAVRRSKGVVCLNTYTRQRVQDLARATWIVPNAVSNDFFKLSRAGSAERQILCTAHIHPWKNQNALIRALDDLARELRFVLVFMGKAEEQSPYTQEFLGLVRSRPRCRHMGGVSRAQIQSALTTAELLVLPSIEDNCPMAVIEAMAAGVPVAAARVGGVPDLIVSGKTGLLFDAQNPAEIRACVRQLLENPEQARTLARNARQFAVENLLPEVVARRHVQLYREVLSSPS